MWVLTRGEIVIIHILTDDIRRRLAIYAGTWTSGEELTGSLTLWRKIGGVKIKEHRKWYADSRIASYEK